MVRAHEAPWFELDGRLEEGGRAVVLWLFVKGAPTARTYRYRLADMLRGPASCERLWVDASALGVPTADLRDELADLAELVRGSEGWAT